MIIKTNEGIYKKIEESKDEEPLRIIKNEDIFVIQNFFEEEFFGVFDRDTYSFVNTNIKASF